MNSSLKLQIERVLDSRVDQVSAVSGGCIASASILETANGERYFLKTLPEVAPPDVFLKEANGLREIEAARSLRVPRVIEATEEFILLEALLPGKRRKGFWENFGRSFARMHRHHSKTFGFFEDNYLGTTPQRNTPMLSADNHSWCDFYRRYRLEEQIKLARENGLADRRLLRLYDRLIERLPEILSGAEENPSLLHGDLWSGNYLVGPDGNACVIDPAAYYGHREADLAMTRLFGGFPTEFYRAYEEEFPLPPGAEERVDAYKLYHLLNHLNLFGSSYYPGVMAAMDMYS